MEHSCNTLLEYRCFWPCQAPCRAVRELGFLPEPAHGVYASRWHQGSPAQRYGMYALHCITHINGVIVPDLDAFVEAVRGLPDGAFVKVKLVNMETTKPKVRINCQGM